jgi:hypothetical protein
MTVEPTPPELIERFNELVPIDPAIERRTALGLPAAFVGGNLCMNLHGGSMVLRLPDDARADLLALPGAKTFEPAPGKPQKEFVVVPDDVLRNAKAVKEWIAKAVAFAKTLPPKAPKTT